MVVGDADVEITSVHNGRTRYERIMDDGRRIVVIVEDDDANGQDRLVGQAE